MEQRWAEHFEGIKIEENPDGSRTITPRNPEPGYGNNDTACWANLGRSPDGHVAMVATGGASSQHARLTNYIRNGNGWLINS